MAYQESENLKALRRQKAEMQKNNELYKGFGINFGNAGLDTKINDQLDREQKLYDVQQSAQAAKANKPSALSLESVKDFVPGQFKESGPISEFQILNQAQRDAARGNQERRLGDIRSQSQSNLQQGIDALRRRFAAMGSLSSGAAIKQEQVAREQSQAAQSGEERRTEQEFAESEKAREATLGFQESQERQRRSEVQDERIFAERQQGIQRNFNREMSNQDLAWKNRVFDFDTDSKLYQLELANQEYNVNLETLEFNRRIAEQEANKSGGLLSWLF